MTHPTIRRLALGVLLSLLLMLPVSSALAQWTPLPSFPGQKFTATTVQDGYLVDALNDGSRFKIRRWNGSDWEYIYQLTTKDDLPTPPESSSVSPVGLLAQAEQLYVASFEYYYASIWMNFHRVIGTTAERLDNHTCSDYRIDCPATGDFHLVEGVAYVGSGTRSTYSLRRIEGLNLVELPPLNLWETDVPGCIDDDRRDAPCSQASRVHDLSSLGGMLYAAGDFVVSQGTPLSGLARLQGEAWTSDGLDLGGSVEALGSYDGRLVVAGSFPAPLGTESASITLYDGATWYGLGTGITGTVHDIVEHEGKLYVGGEFSEAGGLPATNVAVWNGESWDALPALTEGRVTDLHSTNHGLMAIWRSLDGSLNLVYVLEGTVEGAPSSWGGVKARFGQAKRN